MKKTELYIKSTNKVNDLHTIIWEPDVEVSAILQLSHGMVEYIDRYDRFAKFLNTKGILVVGNDHLGHGLTVKDDDEVVCMTSQGKTLRVLANTINQQGTGSTGVKVVKVSEPDFLVGIDKVPGEDNKE